MSLSFIIKEGIKILLCILARTVIRFDAKGTGLQAMKRPLSIRHPDLCPSRPTLGRTPMSYSW
jgi:hypothetical protein